MAETTYTPTEIDGLHNSQTVVALDEFMPYVNRMIAVLIEFEDAGANKELLVGTAMFVAGYVSFVSGVMLPINVVEEPNNPLVAGFNFAAEKKGQARN